MLLAGKSRPPASFLRYGMPIGHFDLDVVEQEDGAVHYRLCDPDSKQLVGAVLECKKVQERGQSKTLEPEVIPCQP